MSDPINVKIDQSADLTWLLEAPSEWITGESGLAAADRTVIEYSAIGLLTAGSRARVDALLILADPVQRAIGARDALGSTGRGSSLIGGLTRANGLTVRLSALAVRSAGRRSARIALVLDRFWRNVVRIKTPLDRR